MCHACMYLIFGMGSDAHMVIYLPIYISECHSGIWINNFTKVCYSIHEEQNAFDQSRQIDFGGWLSIAVKVQIQITMSDITDENEWEPVHMAACKHCYHPHPVAFWLQSHENMLGPQASLTIYIALHITVWIFFDCSNVISTARFLHFSPKYLCYFD